MQVLFILLLTSCVHQGQVESEDQATSAGIIPLLFVIR